MKLQNYERKKEQKLYYIKVCACIVFHGHRMQVKRNFNKNTKAREEFYLNNKIH
jgi:hypothetical protein